MPGEQAHLVDLRWGVAYSLDREITGIGRDIKNVVILRDAAASRFHAEVRRVGDRHMLHVIAKTETKVNGRVVWGMCELAEGDLIEIVYTRLRFTQKALPMDVMPAPAATAVDLRLAERNTEPRELVSTEQLHVMRRRLRRPMPRPERRRPWRWVAIVVGGLAILAVLIALIASLASHD